MYSTPLAPFDVMWRQWKSNFLWFFFLSILIQVRTYLFALNNLRKQTEPCDWNGKSGYNTLWRDLNIHALKFCDVFPDVLFVSIKQPMNILLFLFICPVQCKFELQIALVMKWVHVHCKCSLACTMTTLVVFLKAVLGVHWTLVTNITLSSSLYTVGLHNLSQRCNTIQPTLNTLQQL